MIKNVQEEIVQKSKNTTKKLYRIIIQCTICEKEFEKLCNNCNMIRLTKNENHFCNHQCYGLSRKRNGTSYIKTQKTCLEKFGKTHHMKSKEFLEKFENDMLEKYGNRCSLSIQDVIEKSKKTKTANGTFDRQRQKWIENNPAKNEQTKIKIVQKLKKTMKERYGFENASQVKEIYNKGRKTCKDKFGDEFPNRLPETFRKFQLTCLKRYGVDNPWKTKKFLDKRSQKYHGMSHDEYTKTVPAFKKYRKEVNKITFRQDIKMLKNSEKQSIFCYHLDHKFSVLAGFLEDIEPEIIGNIVNLEFIPAKDNIKKQAKCSVTKEKLFQDYSLWKERNEIDKS